jgi:hypothetical protein
VAVGQAGTGITSTPTLPAIPEWHPSAAPAPTDTAKETPSDTVAAGGVPASASTLTWEAIKATSSGFR